jgi:hypothetical protein
MRRGTSVHIPAPPPKFAEEEGEVLLLLLLLQLLMATMCALAGGAAVLYSTCHCGLWRVMMSVEVAKKAAKHSSILDLVLRR